MGNHCQIHRKFIIAGLLFLAWPALATAQTPTPTATPVGQSCHWEQLNCTPTPTGTFEGTPTSTPETPVPTSDLEGIDLEAPEFPVPTGIAPIEFGTPSPARQFTPIAAPSPFSIELTPWATPNYPSPALTPAATITTAAVDSTISISYTTPMTLTIGGTSTITGSGAISGAIGDLELFTGQLVSYTNGLTGAAAALQGSETITVATAPDWYAPEMPRPLADVGYTIEILTDPTGDTPNFTFVSWASFFGYTATLPYQFIKSLWQLVAYFGPFGLFLAWLLIMSIILVVWYGFAYLVRLIVLAIKLIVRLIEILGGWVPTGG